MTNREEEGKEENRRKVLEARLQSFINQLSAKKGVSAPTVNIVPLKYWVQVASETPNWEDVLAHYSNATETIFLRSDRISNPSILRKDVLHEFAHHLQLYDEMAKELIEDLIKEKVPKREIEAVHELQARGWTSKMLKDKQIRREFDEKVAFDL
jgi:hypothetical protein